LTTTIIPGREFYLSLITKDIISDQRESIRPIRKDIHGLRDQMRLGGFHASTPLGYPVSFDL